MEFYLNSTDLRGCINRLENVEITLKIISTSITDISQNMGNVGLGEVLPNIFLISETLKAHSAKVKCFGDSMLNIVNRYVRAEESIQGDTVLLGQLIDDYAATFGQPDMKLNNSENNPMNQYVEDMLRELGYTNEEIEYIMNDLSQYIGSLYATSHWSTVDLPKILATINELLARRGSGDFTYTINGEVYTISEEEIQILKDAEQGSYGLDYMGYGVYNDQGELIGILPHYVNDGGVTLGYGHYISPGECAADQSEAALIAQYVGENTPLDVSGYGAVPGAEMVPIDVCNELLYNDVQEHLTPIVNFLNEENIQVTENELWALVLYRYNCGHLSNDIMELLREGNRDEAAWSVAWGGASGDRQELCQSVFFN